MAVEPLLQSKVNAQRANTEIYLALNLPNQGAQYLDSYYSIFSYKLLLSKDNWDHILELLEFDRSRRVDKQSKVRPENEPTEVRSLRLINLPANFSQRSSQTQAKVQLGRVKSCSITNPEDSDESQIIKSRSPTTRSDKLLSSQQGGQNQHQGH